MFGKKAKDEVLEHTKQNRDEVLASERCGCASCLAVFPPTQITEWRDEADLDRVEAEHRQLPTRIDSTAICPHCGEVTVIGDHSGHEVTPAFLDALRAHMRT